MLYAISTQRYIDFESISHVKPELSKIILKYPDFIINHSSQHCFVHREYCGYWLLSPGKLANQILELAERLSLQSVH